MNTKPTTIRACFAAAVSAALLAGCSSNYAVIGPFPTRTGRNPWIGAPDEAGANLEVPAAPAAAGQAGESAATDGGPAVAPRTLKRFPCTQLAGTVRVRVDSTAMPWAADLAERGLSDLRDSLARNGFTIDWASESGREDVLVSVRAERKTTDRFGEFETHEADIRATVTVTALAGKVLGDRMFHVDGSRALGEAAADRALADAAVPLLRDWIGRTLSTESIGLAVETCSVSYDAADPEGNQRHARALLARVTSMDGVLDARIVAQDDWRGTVRFRFVYLPEKFPGGLLNAVVRSDPSLQYTPTTPTPRVVW